MSIVCIKASNGSVISCYVLCRDALCFKVCNISSCRLDILSRNAISSQIFYVARACLYIASGYFLSGQFSNISSCRTYRISRNVFIKKIRYEVHGRHDSCGTGRRITVIASDIELIISPLYSNAITSLHLGRSRSCWSFNLATLQVHPNNALIIYA